MITNERPRPKDEKIAATINATAVKRPNTCDDMIGSSSPAALREKSDFIEATIVLPWSAICVSPAATRKPIPGQT